MNLKSPFDFFLGGIELCWGFFSSFALCSFFSFDLSSFIITNKTIMRTYHNNRDVSHV